MPPVRAANFRRELGLTNQWLQRQHPDLFEASVPPFGPQEDALHALLLPVTAKWSDADHSAPLGCVIAVPYSDGLNRYHLWTDVSQLWQYYGEEEGGLGDIAYPKLRDRMRDAEVQTKSEGDKG
jgi:hypothetical protein